MILLIARMTCTHWPHKHFEQLLSFFKGGLGGRRAEKMFLEDRPPSLSQGLEPAL